MIIAYAFIGIKLFLRFFHDLFWYKIKIIKITPFIAFFLLSCGQAFGDYWNTSAVTFGNFSADVELRISSDMYYKHIHFDWHLKLHRYFTLTLSERESYIKKNTWKIEHKPMLNLTYKNGVLKNRSRVTLRIKENHDIWLFRNKITLTLSSFFAAFELFFERGRFFRNRFYIGAVFSKSLIAFLMQQHTRDETIFVFGSKLTARF